jgi:hypothetical protein
MGVTDPRCLRPTGAWRTHFEQYAIEVIYRRVQRLYPAICSQLGVAAGAVELDTLFLVTALLWQEKALW